MNAGAEDSGLLSIASPIADGTGVDWKDVARQLPDQDRAPIVDELRALERFTAVTEITPTQWGPFPIKSELGRGVFGRVFEAVDPDMQLEIALKVIRKGAEDQSADLSRGLKEARLLAKVTHPNVVRIYRVERIADEVGIAMELIRGRALNDLVANNGPLAAREAAVIGIDLCRAVAAVHAAGMIHGDIKAHNVMRETGGRTILMDFGAGRMLDRAVGSEGDCAGTPVYLAPEVFAGKDRTRASDIYSLGVLLYYLVTASYPIHGATGSEVARHHQRSLPRKPLRDARPDLSASFVRVVERALADKSCRPVSKVPARSRPRWPTPSRPLRSPFRARGGNGTHRRWRSVSWPWRLAATRCSAEPNRPSKSRRRPPWLARPRGNTGSRLPYTLSATGCLFACDRERGSLPVTSCRCRCEPRCRPTYMS